MRSFVGLNIASWSPALVFRLGLLSLALVGVAKADAPATAAATQPSSPAKLPYTLTAVVTQTPPQRLWVLQVDLTDPRTHVRVAPGGPDPDGDGSWQTTLLPVSEIAKREKFDLAVNASFFSARDTKDAEGIFSKYRTGVWASAVGWTMTDGRQWSRGNDGWPVLWIDSSGKAHITGTGEVSPEARQVVAGNAWILDKGQDRAPAEGMMAKRHPRTAVGIDQEGKTLTILTVDGRQSGSAIGMTGVELRDELLRHGVWTAINLDGGGSTTLVQRDQNNGELKVLNKPSDGKERPVANVVGVRVGE